MPAITIGPTDERAVIAQCHEKRSFPQMTDRQSYISQRLSVLCSAYFHLPKCNFVGQAIRQPTRPVLSRAATSVPTQKSVRGDAPEITAKAVLTTDRAPLESGFVISAGSPAVEVYYRHKRIQSDCIEPTTVPEGGRFKEITATDYNLYYNSP